MNHYYFELSKTETTNLEWGFSKWLCDPEITGYKEISSCYVSIDPGHGHTNHTHESDEILFFLSGEGEQTIDKETKIVSYGSMVYIPANVEHQTINTGDKPLTFLAVYSPAIKT